MRGAFKIMLVVALLAGCGAASGGATSEKPTVTGIATATARPSATPSAAGATDSVAAGGLRLLLRPDGSGTVLLAEDAATGRTRSRLRLDGRFALAVPFPGAAAEGLSRAGRLLVLPAEGTAGVSRFALLDTRLTGPARIATLAGDFGYDALSPDGSVLYLIQRLGPAGSEHYAVRAYDVGPGRLRDGVIVDKSEPDEVMAGRPVSRAASPDGGIVATLYRRQGETGFVHLLHAADGFAVCADLPVAAQAGWGLAYAADGFTVADPAGTARYTVGDDGQVVALSG